MNAPPDLPKYSIFHIDECMYVAALSEADAVAHVQAECGDDCGELVEPGFRDTPATTADVDEGEQVTPETMTTLGALVDKHLLLGGSLPHTVCFDGGM